MRRTGSFCLFVVAVALFAMRLVGLPVQQQAAVTGSATYRERMVLPSTAIFEAVLEDVSRADAAAEEIGRVRLEKSGMPPFRFSIPYDRSRIKPDRSYSVRARILVDGRLMFITTQAYPVLTRGAGTSITMTMQRSTTAMEGMFRYMADAATFTDCQTGQRWPVAMTAGYKDLESAYTSTRREPGEEMKVNFQGQLEMRPKAEGQGQTLHVVVDKYLDIWPGETCGAPAPAPPLQDTRWKLTRLSGKPVILAERQQEAFLIFRAADNGVAGSTGCNKLTGTYRLNGNALSLSGIAVTRMACVQGMDIEGGLFTALGKVAGWKIAGQNLELLDSGNGVVARFQATKQE
ncbi:MAG TPA: YbaY family lipoprotein [Terriglobia bacterium]|nr:YbaY family lipoprotein [Terriglobia bacterium]